MEKSNIMIFLKKYDNLNEVDYESDKAMLKDLAEDRIKED